MTIEIGDMLPDVTLIASDDSAVALQSLIGRALVLYFYPKADTPGCTNEAKDFSGLATDFDALGARVIGVSRDAPAKLAKFAAKYDLAVVLASDADGTLSDAFGTWIEKSMYGRTYMGMERATFLFDAAGRLVQAWHGVKVKGHADAVLAAVRAL